MTKKKTCDQSRRYSTFNLRRARAHLERFYELYVLPVYQEKRKIELANKRRREVMKKLAVVALLALATSGCGDDLEALFRPGPTQPTNVTVIVNQTQGGTSPGNGQPSPGPGAGVTPTSAKVTIIGGDGSKTLPPSTNFTVTFTRFNGSVEVPGTPTDSVEWTVLGVTDRGSPMTSDPSCGRCVQNYNRDLATGAAGTSFSVTARQGSLEATLVGSVR